MSQSEVLQCGHLSALNIVSTIAAKEFKDNLRIDGYG